LKTVETHWWFEDHGDFGDFDDFVPAEFGIHDFARWSRLSIAVKPWVPCIIVKGNTTYAQFIASTKTKRNGGKYSCQLH